MPVIDLVLEFTPLAEADLPLLHSWLNRPHVVAWWQGEASVDEVREKYLPRLDSDRVRPYLARLDRIPVGYIQAYVAIDDDQGWWQGHIDPGVRGIDQFLADPDYLGQGLGTAMVSQFAALLFRDPRVTRVQADPHPANARAIRCYEKAGFLEAGRIITPDGPALLMVRDRLERSNAAV